MRHFTPAVFVFCITILVCAVVCARADTVPLPAAVAGVVSFHGHIRYQAHPTDDPRATITGALVVNSDAWSLEERSAHTDVFASSEQSWIRSGSQTVVFDDPLDVDAIANSWAVLLATNAGERPIRDAGGTSWTTSAGARIYLDAGQTDVIGAVDTRFDAGSSFAYDQWITVNGVRLPQSIVRMRDGVTVASFVIDSYDVGWDTSGRKTVAQDVSAQRDSQATPTRVAEAAAQHSAWTSFGILVVGLMIALGLVAWARRDALIDHLSRRLANDPRAWRHEGVNVFVSPEGVLFFEGRPYRVGAAFYNRTALMQSSPLFIRVSAPGASRVVVLARKSPLPTRPIVARRSSTGFTLIEALAASAVFATVVVAAVFPTLVVLAHADRLAAQRELALQIATNALADEQDALAYGLTIKDESKVTMVDGMKVTESLTPAGVAGLHSLAVEVAGASGQTLARVVTEIGPPVPTPGGPSPSPSGAVTPP